MFAGMSAGVALLCAVSACANVPELPKRATEAVFSPDGKRLAFQQDVGGRYAVGIFDLADGAVTWVENGPGQACHPAWAGNEMLVYTAFTNTQTAYKSLVGRSDAGYNIWAWKNGRKIRLTSGRCHDTTPSVSPDGRTVYFASDRAVVSDNALAAGGNLSMYSLAAEKGAKPVVIRAMPSNVSGAAVSQPQVSPDGRCLVWAEKGVFLENWHLKLAKAAKPDYCCRLTPIQMAAYAPRWVAGGAYIVFTAYRPGDEGWGIYLLEPKSGAMKRVCAGKEGAVSPDGRTLVYEDLSGDLQLRGLSEADYPDPASADTALRRPPERVLWSGVEPARDRKMKLDPAFVSGTDDILFVRAEVEFPDSLPTFEHLFVAAFGESSVGIQLYIAKGRVWFASRWTNNRYNDYAGVNSTDGVIGPGFKGVLTGVRTPEALYLQIDDGAPVSWSLNGVGTKLRTPQTFHVGRPANEGRASKPFSGKIKKLEYGTGYPKNFRGLLTAKEVLK